jgi:hypothetical protein
LPFERLAPPLPPLPPFPPLPLRDDAAPPRDDDEPLRDDELRLREDAAGERRLDALLLFCLLDGEPRLLLPLPRDELPLLFGLDPFELREVVCFLLPERDLAWAITPP